MVMKTEFETYVGKDGMSELDLELGRILMRIHRKWQQSGDVENIRSKASVPLEEMETVIILADSETDQSVLPIEEELTETIVLSPLKHEEKTGAAEWSLDEIPETLIIAPGSIREEESLDETIMLPPKKERPKRRG